MLSTNGDIVIPTYKNIKGHPVLIKDVLLIIFYQEDTIA